MAAEKKEKKRKAATSSAAPAPNGQPLKKPKKSTTTKAVKPDVEAKAGESANPKSTKGIDGVATQKGPATAAIPDDKPARKTKQRKRAADFLSDDEETTQKKSDTQAPNNVPESKEDASKPAKKKSRKTAEPAPEELGLVAKDDNKVAGGSKKTRKSNLLSDPSLKETQLASDSDNENASDDDDQTTALISGFESSGDEDISGDEGFEPGQEVPEIPDSKQVKRKMRKKEKRNKVEAEKPEQEQQRGVVYVGHIPHGFFEHEMRAYFSQFGTITQLRLSRNRTTGRSKHFAFIEFASAAAARVVADTMNSYLMFGHILRCEVVPPERVHPATFKGANRRFKRTPWNQIEKRRLDAGKTREQWQRKIKTEEKRRGSKAEKMKALGYEMEVPELKGSDEAPVPVQQAQIGGETEAAKAVEEPAEEKGTEKLAAGGEDEAIKEVSEKKKTKEKTKEKSEGHPDAAPAADTTAAAGKAQKASTKENLAGKEKEKKKSKKADKASKKSAKA